jgi:cytochrome c
MRSWTGRTLPAVLLLAGCGAPPPDPNLSPLAQQGQAVFAQCAACHSIEAGGQHRSGPNLYGVVGARVGVHPGYNYSAALAGADAVWTRERLDSWLADPSSEFPGHKMAYAGLVDAPARRALIAFLEEAGSEIPDRSATDAPSG